DRSRQAVESVSLRALSVAMSGRLDVSGDARRGGLPCRLEHISDRASDGSGTGMVAAVSKERPPGPCSWWVRQGSVSSLCAPRAVNNVLMYPVARGDRTRVDQASQLGETGGDGWCSVMILLAHPTRVEPPPDPIPWNVSTMASRLPCSPS